MGDIQTVTKLIQEVGFPIIASLLVAAGFWLVLKFMMSQLLSKIDGLYKRIDQVKKEHDMELKAHKEITLGLLRRIRTMDNDLLRLDTTIRLIHSLEIDLERIGRREHSNMRED